MRDFSSQRGNVLFIILLAIALFAALSYAALQGSRSGTAGMTDEQARMAAQEIISYGNTMQTRAQQLRLQGCLDTQLDFANPVWARVDGLLLTHEPGHNPNAPASGCSIFENTLAKVFNDAHVYWPDINSCGGCTALGTSRIIRLILPGVGTAAGEDLVYRLAYVREEVCIAINKSLGITNPSDKPPHVTNTSTTMAYDGDYTGAQVAVDSSGAVTGKTAFCASGVATPTASSGDYSYLQVLIAR